MEYIYSAMLLYSAGKDITEDAIKAVLTSAGVNADTAKIKLLVSSLEGVNIKEAISNAVVTPSAGPATVNTEASKTAPTVKEESKEEAVSEEEAAAGLSALFG